MEHNGQEIETFVWKGQTRYRCPHSWESGAKCQFDAGSREAIVAHMQAPHLRKLPSSQPPPVPTPVPEAVHDTEARAADFKEASFAPE